MASTVAVGALAAAPTGALSASTCDRNCLKGVLDAYLDGVVRHDPKAARLAPSYRATENAVATPKGEGLWKTASALGGVQRRFADPVNGQAAYFGQLKEGTQDDIVNVRVKVVDGKVTEAEWTVARPGADGMFDPRGLEANPPMPDTPLPMSQRTPRAAMIAAGNAYFDGLQLHDGSAVPHEPNCERVENGVKVTHRPRRLGPPGGPIPGAAPAPAPAAGAPTAAQEELSGNCADNFEGFKNSILGATQRRFPIVDEEAGVVLGDTLFSRPPTTTMKRNLLSEYFFVRQGKIAGIWAAMYYMDPKLPNNSGWWPEQ